MEHTRDKPRIVGARCIHVRDAVLVEDNFNRCRQTREGHLAVQLREGLPHPPPRRAGGEGENEEGN